MVTASHNPKQDNGFKVYWGNGSQIVPPHDNGIANAIEQNLKPWQEGYNKSDEYITFCLCCSIINTRIASNQEKPINWLGDEIRPILKPDPHDGYESKKQNIKRATTRDI